MNARIESTIDASRSSSGVRVRVIPSSAAGAARDAARLLVQILVARRPGLTLRPAVRARRALHASLRAPGRTTRVAKGTAGDARLGAVRRLRRRLRRTRRVGIRVRQEHVPRRPEERPQPPPEEPSVRVSRVRRRVRAPRARKRSPRPRSSSRRLREGSRRRRLSPSPSASSASARRPRGTRRRRRRARTRRPLPRWTERSATTARGVASRATGLRATTERTKRNLGRFEREPRKSTSEFRSQPRRRER